MTKTMLIPCLCLSLLGCATPQTSTVTQLAQSQPFQNALAEAAVVRIIEKSKDPKAMAEKIVTLAAKPVTDLATGTLTVTIHDSLGYANLPVSEQILVDAVITAITQDLANAEASQQDQLAVVERWRTVALAAATRYLSSK